MDRYDRLLGMEPEPEPPPKFDKNIDNVPRDLFDCYQLLNEAWEKSDQIYWKDMEEKKALAAVHSGIGQHIRNEWGLWRGSKLALWFNSIGIIHPDDMSSIILTSYHRKLNDRPTDLYNQVRYYQDYWEKHDMDRDHDVQAKLLNLLEEV